jgi:cell division protein FtsQ
MKTGLKRGSSASVLEAPEDDYASARYERGPAPAGALRRELDAADDARASAIEKPAFERAPRNVRIRFRSLPRSVGGRVAAAVAALAALAIAAVAVLMVRQFLYHDAQFLLAGPQDIQMIGNHRLSRAQALSVFGEDMDRNLFHVPLAERKADLERLPWVEHATVMRLLPHTLRVAIAERTPVAFVRQGTQIGLVDANGVILDMPADAAGDPHYSFPVLTGISAGDPLSTRRARMELYTAFMQEMADGGEQVTDSLSEVDVTDPEDVRAVVTSGGSDLLVHFGDERFLERYRIFEEHLSEWKQTYPNLTSADMRYNNQIVLDSGNAVNTLPAASAAGTPGAADAAAQAAGSPPAAHSPAAGSPASVAAHEKALAHVQQQAAAGARAAALKPGKPAHPQHPQPLAAHLKHPAAGAGGPTP